MNQFPQLKRTQAGGPNDMTSHDLSIYLQGRVNDAQSSRGSSGRASSNGAANGLVVTEPKFRLDSHSSCSSAELTKLSESQLASQQRRIVSLQNQPNPKIEPKNPFATQQLEPENDSSIFNNLKARLLQMREKSMSSGEESRSPAERHRCQIKPDVPSQKYKRAPKQKKQFAEEADKVVITRQNPKSRASSKASSNSKQPKKELSPRRLSRGRQMAKPHKKQQEVPPQRSASSLARLHDLCPEDKAKIGELVKKLATEQQQKQESQKKFEEEKRRMEDRINELSRRTTEYELERESLASKFQQSLKMLQDLKQSHDTLAQSNMQREQELSKERERFESETKLIKQSLAQQFQQEI